MSESQHQPHSTFTEVKIVLVPHNYLLNTILEDTLL